MLIERKKERIKRDGGHKKTVKWKAAWKAGKQKL